MPIISLTLVFTLIVILSYAIHSFISTRGIKYLNYLLGLFLFARFGQMFVYLLIDNELIVYAPALLKLFCPLYYIAPSLVYLYTVGLLNDQTSLRKKDYLHFIPGLISFVDDLPWYFSSSINWNEIAAELIETKNINVVAETGLFPAEIYLYIQPILFTVYLILSFRLLIKSPISERAQGAGTKRLWLLGGLGTITVFHVLDIVSIYFRYIGLYFDENYKIYMWVFGVGLVLFLTITILLLHNPRILYGYILVHVGEKNRMIDFKDVKASSKTKGSKVKVDANLIQTIQNYMMHEKPYLNSSFSIMDLANAFKMPTHKCSALINTYIGKNFRDWINQYRIEYFIQTYPQKSQKLTVDAIAFESGFISMTTFYRAFKKETGKMPVNYFSN